MKKTIQRIGIAGLLFAGVSLFSGLGQTNKPPAFNPQINDAFGIGARLGYKCAKAGGNTNDLDMFIKAFNDNRPDLIEGWLQGR